jgi:hypothetical protein
LSNTFLTIPGHVIRTGFITKTLAIYVFFLEQKFYILNKRSGGRFVSLFQGFAEVAFLLTPVCKRILQV